MSTIDLIRLVKRNFLFIVLASLIGLTAGYGVTKLRPIASLENSLFYSFSVNAKNASQNNSYENLQAADQITESIQGWIKDPAFQDTINRQANLNIPIKAKKQEKNNLIISFDSHDSSQSDSYQKAIDQELRNRLNKYSQTSSFEITIGGQSFYQDSKFNLSILIILAGLIIAKLLGILFSYLFEKYTNKLVTEDELSKIIEHKGLFYFGSLNQFKRHHAVLAAYLDRKYHQQKIQLINLTRKPKVGLETLSSMTGEVEMKCYEFPKQIKEIKAESPAIILVQLGESSAVHIKQLNLFNLEKHEVIVFNRI